MKSTLTALAALALATPAAGAEPTTFTFKTANSPVMMLGNGEIVGSTYSGTSTNMWADGKKTQSSYTCVSTGNAPHDHVFQTTTVCDVKAAEGNYTSVWGCNAMEPEKKMMGCVGGLRGQTGAYAGRSGGATFAGDAAGGHGTGQWGG